MKGGSCPILNWGHPSSRKAGLQRRAPQRRLRGGGAAGPGAAAAEAREGGGEGCGGWGPGVVEGLEGLKGGLGHPKAKGLREDGRLEGWNSKAWVSFLKGSQNVSLCYAITF